MGFGGDPQGVFAGAGNQQAVPFAVEGLVQQLEVDFIVVYQQDDGGCRFGC